MKTHLLLLFYLWRRRRRLSFSTCYTETNDGEDDLLLFYMLVQNQKKFVHSRNRKVFYNTLSEMERYRRSRKIPRPCLLAVNKSSWRKLYEAKDDSAMITVTGSDHSSFEELHDPNNAEGVIKRIEKGGRTRKFSSRDFLGLYLAWTRTRGAVHNLSLMFGITGSAVSTYLRYARRLLIHVLKGEDSAVVRIPNEEEISTYKAAVGSRHPMLNDVWLAMDGLKLYIEQSPNGSIQSRFYNGWTHDHYVTNLFGFTPAGTIAVACVCECSWFN